MLCMRNFEKAKRIVIKIGTNTLTKKGWDDTALCTKLGG